MEGKDGQKGRYDRYIHSHGFLPEIGKAKRPAIPNHLMSGVPCGRRQHTHISSLHACSVGRSVCPGFSSVGQQLQLGWGNTRGDDDGEIQLSSRCQQSAINSSNPSSEFLMNGIGGVFSRTMAKGRRLIRCKCMITDRRPGRANGVDDHHRLTRSRDSNASKAG